MIGYRVRPSNKSEEPPWKMKILWFLRWSRCS